MDTLREHLSKLSPLVSNAVIYSVESLLKGDQALARRISDDDRRIHSHRIVIEESVYHCLETPLNAHEARFAVSVVVVSQNLVRIGDNAANIAAIVLRMIDDGGSRMTAEAMEKLTDMAYSAAEMINDAVSAFINRDKRLAEATVRRDREISEAFDDLSVIATPIYQTPEQRLRLQWTLNHLQQIGMYAANICERAIFVATGEIKEFH